MKRTTVWILLLLSAFCSFAQEHLRLDENDFRGKLVPKSLLSKISIHLDNAPFEVALATISEMSNIKLNYSRENLPLETEVSLHEENIYAMEALLTVLKNTGTILKITQEGQLAIVPQESRPEPTANVKGSIRDRKSVV